MDPVTIGRRWRLSDVERDEAAAPPNGSGSWPCSAVWHAAVFLPLDAGVPADGMGFAQAALLSPGAPAGGLGETAVADTLAVAADVIDTAGNGKRREQRAPGVLGVQRGAQARVRMIFTGARAVEKPEAQHNAAPPGRRESGG